MSESNMQKMQSASDYTPTTEEVRKIYVVAIAERDNWLKPTVTKFFDRWLAEHDREVKAQAIDDAIAYLKTTPAVTLTGKGGGYELLETYRQDAK